MDNNKVNVILYLLAACTLGTTVISILLNVSIRKYENEKRKEKQFNAISHNLKDFNKRGMK